MMKTFQTHLQVAFGAPATITEAQFKLVQTEFAAWRAMRMQTIWLEFGIFATGAGLILAKALAETFHYL